MSIGSSHIYTICFYIFSKTMLMRIISGLIYPTSGKVRIQGKELRIAAAIMEKPEILILDEPLNALDTNGVELFTKIINEEKEK